MPDNKTELRLAPEDGSGTLFGRIHAALNPKPPEPPSPDRRLGITKNGTVITVPTKSEAMAAR